MPRAHRLHQCCRRTTAPSGMSKFQLHGCACTRLPHACCFPLTIFSILPGGRPEPASCRRLCRCLAGIFFAPLRGTEGDTEGEAGLLSEVASCILPLTLLPYPMQAMCGGPWPCQLARGLRRSGQCIRCPDAPSWDWDWPAVFYTASRRDNDAEDSSCVPFASLARPGLRR